MIDDMPTHVLSGRVQPQGDRAGRRVLGYLLLTVLTAIVRETKKNLD